MAINIITLHESDFREKCKELEQLVSTSYTPDFIIGIKHGGEYVSKNMMLHLPHFAIKCQRKSTPLKEKLNSIFVVLQNMPLWFRDLLRIVESKILPKKSRAKAAIVLDDPFPDITDKKILLVDDAVDSGITLKSVFMKLKEAFPTAQIRTAVFTVTTSDPIIKPDYYLFKEKTLIRFPWSKDYKQAE